MLVVVFAGASVMLAIAGCTSTPDSPGETATHAAPKPALADLVLTPDSLGDIRIGRPVPTTTLIAKYDPTACDLTATGTSQGSADPGAWEANYLNQPTAAGTKAPFIIVTAKQRPAASVRGLWVWTPGVHTEEGITVGSSRAQVQAAYPNPDEVRHGPLSDVYVLDGVGGRLLIEIARSDNGDAGHWSPSQVDTVLWMGAITPHGTVTPIAGTGDIPAACPDGAN